MTDNRHRYRFTPALHDMDAAGVMFFGHLYRHLHDAYEDFMAEIGQPLSGIIEAGTIGLPITHSESTHRHPITHGARLWIELWVEEMGETEFVIAYRVLDREGRLYATARTRHVCIEAGTRERRRLPEELCAALGGC